MSPCRPPGQSAYLITNMVKPNIHSVIFSTRHCISLHAITTPTRHRHNQRRRAPWRHRQHVVAPPSLPPHRPAAAGDAPPQPTATDTAVPPSRPHCHWTAWPPPVPTRSSPPYAHTAADHRLLAPVRPRRRRPPSPHACVPTSRKLLLVPMSPSVA